MANAFYLFQSRENNFPSKEKEFCHVEAHRRNCRFGIGFAALRARHSRVVTIMTPITGLTMVIGGPNYHHGYYGRPVVVAPYVVGRPIYAPPVYRPYPCHGYRGYYAEPSGGIYIQGRNFSLGIGY